MSKGSVVRLIRINKLIDELKALVDSGDIAIRAGVELSFLSEDTQAVVAGCAEDCKIDMKKAKMLRASADDEGNIERYTVESIISGENGEAKPKPPTVRALKPPFGKISGTARVTTDLTIPKHRTSIICLTSGLMITTAQADMTGPMWARSHTDTADTIVS